MNEIKHTPGPWIWAPDYKGLYGAGPNNAVLDHEFCEGMWLANVEQREANAKLIETAPDMALALEMIAAEDDAARHNGTPLLTSGVRMTLDAALIKAGRKAAPEPVRHVTIAGGAK
ncbi:hypothetical protein [Burkholderia multivorans]|uniref:hypothetical protein n=1 Tax=Burkholderia multivorans TaxID=87883 RepID=UPI0021C242E8|nr:hypothetical protein [Burkholderia multivorans]